MTNTIQSSLELFTKERAAILVDDTGAQERGVFVSPAASVDAPLFNRLLQLSGGGIPFVSVSPERASAFMLERMARPATHTRPLSEASPNACLSVEAREGISTGISASDRAATIAILGETPPQPRKLVKPGHIFPIEVRAGGVLVKNALPEGALDFVTTAGFSDAALLIDLLDSGGEFLGLSHCESIATRENLPLVTLRDLVRFRLEHEKLVHRIAEAKLPTTLAGEVRSYVYRSTVHSGEHIALVKGQVDDGDPVLTRVQPEFTFADVFGGDTPPTRALLQRSLAAIGQRGRGVLVYLRRPLGGQLKEQVEEWSSAYQQKQATMMREYGLGAQILRDLGVRRIEMLSSSKKDISGLETFGIEIVAKTPIPEACP